MYNVHQPLAFITNNMQKKSKVTDLQKQKKGKSIHKKLVLTDSYEYDFLEKIKYKLYFVSWLL